MSTNVYVRFRYITPEGHHEATIWTTRLKDYTIILQKGGYWGPLPPSYHNLYFGVPNLFFGVFASPLEKFLVAWRHLGMPFNVVPEHVHWIESWFLSLWAPSQGGPSGPSRHTGWSRTGWTAVPHHHPDPTDRKRKWRHITSESWTP